MPQGLERALPTRYQLQPLADGIVILLQTGHLILADGTDIPQPAHDPVIEGRIAEFPRILHSVLQRVRNAARIGNGLIEIFPSPHHQRPFGLPAQEFHLADGRINGAEQKLSVIRLQQSLAPRRAAAVVLAAWP